MEEKDIINFRNSLADMSIEDMEAMIRDLNNQINQMILNSDLVMKIGILDAAIKDRKAQ